jgi:hypothetical protein
MSDKEMCGEVLGRKVTDSPMPMLLPEGAVLLGRRTGAGAEVSISWPSCGGGRRSLTERAYRMADACAMLGETLANLGRVLQAVAETAEEMSE